MAETIRPIKDKVLVQLQARETKEGSIHLPEASQEAHIFGIVCATGEDVPDEIQDGDQVLILRTSGTHIRKNGVDFILIAADKIRAKEEVV
tara:strand:- start:331 stop:603 length:273 start_codon:yes stop_codon:yes gene_type:complete